MQEYCAGSSNNEGKAIKKLGFSIESRASNMLNKYMLNNRKELNREVRAHYREAQSDSRFCERDFEFNFYRLFNIFEARDSIEKPSFLIAFPSLLLDPAQYSCFVPNR